LEVCGRRCRVVNGWCGNVRSGFESWNRERYCVRTAVLCPTRAQTNGRKKKIKRGRGKKRKKKGGDRKRGERRRSVEIINRKRKKGENAKKEERKKCFVCSIK